jgi:hypothetical protein
LTRVTRFQIQHDIQSLCSIFEKYQIPLNKTVKDSIVNNYGYKLVDLCRNNDIYIVNGRIGSDRHVGGVTCKNCSTVDYVITSVYIFELIQSFDIIDFCSL